MNRWFCDLDGVVVDMDRLLKEEGKTSDELKREPGAYLRMPEYPGAIAGVRSLIGMGWDVWIATKPATGIAATYADKVSWVLQGIPELKRKIVLTHDKGMLGDEGDVLLDDRPHANNSANFRGTLIRFGGSVQWPQVLDQARLLLRVPDRASLEVSRLRRALIAREGDGLCWFDPGTAPLPPKVEFLSSCGAFWDQTSGSNGEAEGCRTIAQLVLDNQRLRTAVNKFAEIGKEIKRRVAADPSSRIDILDSFGVKFRRLGFDSPLRIEDFEVAAESLEKE